MRKPITTALFVVLALLALAAPAGAATSHTDGFELELEIFDLHTSTACEADVFADVSGTWDRRVQRNQNGTVEKLTETFHGQITWFTRGTGKSYTSQIDNSAVVTFPEGVGFFKPARITVTGQHGGTFPIGGGPAGHGKVVYDGFVYSFDDEDVPYWATEGDPVGLDGNFTRTTERICAALS